MSVSDDADWPAGYLDTVADVRRFLEPFADDCPVHGDLRLLFVLDLQRGSFLIADATAMAPHSGTPEQEPHQ